jgi:hypothetical protein
VPGAAPGRKQTDRRWSHASQRGGAVPSAD